MEYPNAKLLFRSDFDSGNLWKAELNKDTNVRLISFRKSSSRQAEIVRTTPARRIGSIFQSRASTRNCS